MCGNPKTRSVSVFRNPILKYKVKISPNVSLCLFNNGVILMMMMMMMKLQYHQALQYRELYFTTII